MTEAGPLNLPVEPSTPPAPPDLIPKTGEVVIYLWPYCAEAERDASKNISSDPVSFVVAVFGGLWLAATLFFLVGVRCYSNLYLLFKYIPLVFLPVLALGKGITHIRVTPTGLVFQATSGKLALRSKRIAWVDVKRLYVSKPKNSQSPLSGKLVIATKSLMSWDDSPSDSAAAAALSTRHSIPLKKIGSPQQWQALITAMSRYTDVSELDPALLNNGIGAARDPSYTKLWLEALTAPPKRERLQPLSTGVELQKGRFHIKSLLGGGGQGSAYLAECESGLVVLKEYILPVYVDVKVRRQALEEFENESRLLCSLDHPGIVKSLGFFLEDHRAYLVLEYVQGKSLRELVQENGPFSEKACRSYALEMCKILHYLHAQAPPVVHRDFTPDNLLLEADGTLKLIDFMVAKQQHDESLSNMVVGKRHYMPPEQFVGKTVPESDIYAFGCTLHFLLTGHESEPMTPSHPILSNENITLEMNNLVEKATTLDRHQRYRSADAIISDLLRIEEAEPVPSTADGLTL